MSDKFNKVSGMLVYVQVQEPVKAFVKAGAPKKPDEWKASVVLTDEDYVDELEEYGKSLDTLLSIKKVKTADFEAKYKVAPPEGAGKNVWIFTLRKSTELGKTGKPVPDLYKPRVMQKIKNTMVDITHEKLVGNGSYGTISVDKFERTTGGASLFLKNILVTDLKEYIAAESDYVPGDEFGDDQADDGNGGTAKVPAKAKTAVKAAAKQVPKDTPQDNDDPF